MANKYIIEGATYNGDGTTSSEAASAGAAGAWNHVDIIAGVATGFGSISAGDVIYIRSKTGNGADGALTYTPSAATTFGLAAGTAASPVKWILDNGTTWSGINGTFTISSATGTHYYTLRAYNEFISLTAHNWIFENTSTSLTFGQMTINSGYTSGLKLTLTNSSTSGYTMKFVPTSFGATHKDMYLYNNTFSSTYAPIGCDHGVTTFIDPTFYVNTAPGALQGVIFATNTHGIIDIFGGQFLGAAINSGNMAAFAPNTYYAYASTVRTYGFQVPKAAPIVHAQPASGSTVTMTGLDNGLGGAYSTVWGNADNRNVTNNYPTLNATSATSGSTPLSWKIYPKAATKQIHFSLPITKLYTDTAATKTLTLHFLATTTWSGTITPDTETVWMNVNYIDSTTGLPVNQTTRATVGAALTTSGLTWTPSNAWGAVSLTAYKLELTTGTSIKQDTAITIAFMGSTTSGNANDIYILCPDIQLS